MKKNINVIQIKGIKGILYIAFIGCCLAAGFVWFPGWTCMKIWNITSHFIQQIPQIGVIQGLLLWGILAASYFTFRKERHVVCFKSADGLSEEEIKEVFADIKKQANNDIFLKNLIKTREAELKFKNLSDSSIPQNDISDKKEKIESK